jgi:hypothetical protein
LELGIILAFINSQTPNSLATAAPSAFYLAASDGQIAICTSNVVDFLRCVCQLKMDIIGMILEARNNFNFD